MSTDRRSVFRARREVRELSLLYEISRTLDRSLDLRQVVGPVLEAMAEQMGMQRGTLTLLDRETGELAIETAYGLTEAQRRRGRYRIGEGVTGMVVKTGTPAVVPRVSEEPLFLDRTRARRHLGKSEISFICVPIKVGRETIGALSADRLFAENVSLSEDLRLLSLIASLVGQAVKLRQEFHDQRRTVEEENLRLREELRDRFRPANMVGASKAMQGVYDLIEKVAASDTTVLLRGESGTGKELVASALHYLSRRSGKPFVKVNCAALPETIIESELFGHEKGAFTGALARRKGRFEIAHGGTIFLDEIGDLTPATQARLLRVIQEREFERVGGSETIHADVRVIAATNRDLETMVEAGTFRRDLLYRLDVFPVRLPPLRERREDILPLADHFVGLYAAKNGKPVRRISTPAIDMLLSYHWPGNVRELENVIERAVILSADGVIRGYHLPPSLQTAKKSDTRHAGDLRLALAALEREMITDALKSSRGNMSRAADALGITERIMGLRCRTFGIDYRRFRTRA